MTENQIRWVGVAALSVIATGASIWLGEDLRSVIHTGAFLLVPCSFLLGYLVTPGSSVAGRLCVACIIVLGTAGGWYLGRTTATGAFNDCIARGEMIRVSLARFRTEHGGFPDDLDQLGLRDLPGERWLRGYLLAYRRTPDGYELGFSDWLVAHRATESEAFVARK